MREVVKLGYKAICLTVDALAPGNRESDIKAPWVLERMEQVGNVDSADIVRVPGDTEIEEEETNMGGTAGALISNVDKEMTWEKVISKLWILDYH